MTGISIREFARFPQAVGYAEVASFFPLRLDQVFRLQCSWSFACSGVWLAIFPVSCGRRFLKQAKTELPSDTAQLRHTGVTTGSGVL